ncbi:MAG: hypothetical protein EA369_08845 [Bradymonadales bacterium]|nr:MAG: hypothetical protein EA369_08845 [Bradymonadales bacterium]
MVKDQMEAGRQPAVVKIDLSQLGSEAQSMLRSIRTENAKLCQAKALAQSDVHYFRARHNYYRLSLRHLQNEERKLLEPVLVKFRENIWDCESRLGLALKEGRESITPFLTPVEQENPAPAPVSPPAEKEAYEKEILSEFQPSKEVFNEALPQKRAVGAEQPEALAGFLKDLGEEMELIQFALEGKASQEKNAKYSRAIGRLRVRLGKQLDSLDH